MSENLGDVHDEIIHLCDLVGLPKPKGNFIEGWTTGDLLQIGIDPREYEDE